VNSLSIFLSVIISRAIFYAVVILKYYLYFVTSTYDKKALVNYSSAVDGSPGLSLV